MATSEIFSIVGVCLIVLGGASGVTLFARAAFAGNKDFEGRHTLWGLFIVCLGTGLILVAFTR